jgi:hypothetical protein
MLDDRLITLSDEGYLQIKRDKSAGSVLHYTVGFL